MSKTGKRPIRALTAHEKLEAIKRVHDGESKASVARDIGVPESTLRGWCKNETKISYQSRQSSPDTDESYEPKEKRAKVEQPFNLSLSKNMYTPPNSESLYTPLDFSKTDMDSAPKTPQNLSIKNEIPKSTASQMTEREKTRAELARLSVELGLNRPEMFATSTSGPSSSTNNATLADLAANITLLSQWNNMMMQQQLMQSTTHTSKKQQQQQHANAAIPESSSSSLAAPAAMKNHTGGSAAKLPKEQQSVDDYIKCWLRTQEAILTNQSRGGASLPTSNGLASPPTAAPPAATSMPTTSNNGAASVNNASSAYQSSWFWKWYKQLSYNQQTLSSSSSLQQPLAEKPILYQQLTKDGENLSSAIIGDSNKPSPNSSNNKARSVLDNLLSINNNNNNNQVGSAAAIKKEHQNGGSSAGDVLTQSEALEHGEKFMKWLETCSDPSVTAMQIMQFKSLLNNIKNRAEQKNNGDLQHNKTKVKRK